MTIVIHETHAQASAVVSAEVMAAIQTRRDPVLGLPTGRTPVAVYDALALSPLDWSEVRTFNLDEFAGIPATDPGSFRAFMEEHLFSRVPLRPDHIGFLRGDTGDDAAECARYEHAISAVGGIDLLLLGLGTNGHIGFNEPGPSLRAPTHAVTLHQSTRAANAHRFGGDPARVPPRALTMGMRHVLGARRIVALVTGASKSAAVAAMVTGPLTTECPASWLQVHRAVMVVVDRAAAAQLG